MVEVGEEFGRVDGPVTRDEIKAYAKASGDSNPIHTDEKFATEKGGLNGVIAHGMLFYGFCIHGINEWALNNNGKLLSIKAELRGMVRPGDWVLTEAKVTAVEGNLVSVEINQYSKMPLKLEKDGEVVKVFEGEERKWVKEKEMEGITTEETDEGTLTFRKWISIKGSAVIQLE